MATAVTNPLETQLLVNIEDVTLLKDIKKAISMVRGVTKVSVPHRKRYSAYELSMRDLKEGRVNSYASVDDFFQKWDSEHVSD